MARTQTKRTKLEIEPKKTARLDEIGVTGLSEFSGQIQEDFLRELRGKEGYKRFNEMRLNSAIVGAMLLAIEQSIRGISWEFISDLGAEDERVIFLGEALKGMSHSWNDHVAEALTMLPFGFSIFEIVYKRDTANRLTWRKFSIRGQETVHRWLFDEDGSGGIAGFEQLTTKYQIKTLPIEKLLLYRTRVERNNPEGRSILRTAWTSYYYAKHIQQIEAIGIERDLAGLPVITLPQTADTTDSSTSDFGIAKKIVRNIRNDEQAGVVKPFGWEMELLSTGGTRQFDTNEIVKRYESRMLMSALAEFLMLGQESIGSMALSKDKTDFFAMSVNAIADIIAETFTKYAIPRLLALNGYDIEGVTLEHTPAGDVDISFIADFLQKVGAMITWNAEDEVWLRQLARLPDRDAEELQAERDEREAQAAAAREALMERVGRNDNPQDEMSTTMYFEADAPDDAQRRKREREWEKALTEYFEAARKRMLKAAKEMKG